MSPRLFLVIGWILVLALFANGIVLWRETRALQAQMAHLGRQKAEADDRVVRLAKELEAAKAETAKRSTIIPSSPAPAKTVPTVANAFEAGRKLLAEDPALKPLLADYFRATIARQHTLFYRRMSWNAEQIARFEDIMMTGMVRNITVGSHILPVALGEVSTQVTVEARLFTEFGVDFADAYREFKRTGELDQIMMKVNTDLVATDRPLSSPQLEALAATLKSSSSSFGSGGRFERSTVQWDQVLAGAKSSLTPKQYEALERTAREAQYQVAVNVATIEANRVRRNGAP